MEASENEESIGDMIGMATSPRGPPPAVCLELVSRLLISIGIEGMWDSGDSVVDCVFPCPAALVDVDADGDVLDAIGWMFSGG